MYGDTQFRDHTGGSQPTFEEPVQFGHGQGTVPGIFLDRAGSHPDQFSRGEDHFHTRYFLAV